MNTPPPTPRKPTRGQAITGKAAGKTHQFHNSPTVHLTPQVPGTKARPMQYIIPFLLSAIILGAAWSSITQRYRQKRRQRRREAILRNRL